MMNRPCESFYYKVNSNLKLDKNGRGMPRFQKLGEWKKNSIDKI